MYVLHQEGSFYIAYFVMYYLFFIITPLFVIDIGNVNMTDAEYYSRYKQCPMLNGNCTVNKNQCWYNCKRNSIFAGFAFAV